MAKPMKTFVTDDGRRFLIPGDAQEERAEAIAGPAYHCTCHEKMGNDFWFLPTGSCLRKEKVCDHVNP